MLSKVDQKIYIWAEIMPVFFCWTYCFTLIETLIHEFREWENAVISVYW